MKNLCWIYVLAALMSPSIYAKQTLKLQKVMGEPQAQGFDFTHVGNVSYERPFNPLYSDSNYIALATLEPEPTFGIYSVDRNSGQLTLLSALPINRSDFKGFSQTNGLTYKLFFGNTFQYWAFRPESSSFELTSTQNVNEEIGANFYLSNSTEGYLIDPVARQVLTSQRHRFGLPEHVPYTYDDFQIPEDGNIQSIKHALNVVYSLIHSPSEGDSLNLSFTTLDFVHGEHSLDPFVYEETTFPNGLKANQEIATNTGLDRIYLQSDDNSIHFLERPNFGTQLHYRSSYHLYPTMGETLILSPSEDMLIAQSQRGDYLITFQIDPESGEIISHNIINSDSMSETKSPGFFSTDGNFFYLPGRNHLGVYRVLESGTIRELQSPKANLNQAYRGPKQLVFNGDGKALILNEDGSFDATAVDAATIEPEGVLDLDQNWFTPTHEANHDRISIAAFHSALEKHTFFAVDNINKRLGVYRDSQVTYDSSSLSSLFNLGDFTAMAMHPPSQKLVLANEAGYLLVLDYNEADQSFTVLQSFKVANGNRVVESVKDFAFDRSFERIAIAGHGFAVCSISQSGSLSLDYIELPEDTPDSLHTNNLDRVFWHPTNAFFYVARTGFGSLAIYANEAQPRFISLNNTDINPETIWANLADIDIYQPTGQVMLTNRVLGEMYLYNTDFANGVLLPNPSVIPLCGTQQFSSAGQIATYRNRVYVNLPGRNQIALLASQATKQIVPWMVNNQQFRSQISLFNYGSETAQVRMSLKDPEGRNAGTHYTDILPGEMFTQEIGDFSHLVNSWAVTVDSGDQPLHVSYMTYSLEKGNSAKSPSQTTATSISQASKSLRFAYVPGDQTAAAVIVAPENEGIQEVILRLVGPSFESLAEKTITLFNDRPYAFLIADIFPDIQDAAALMATSTSAELVGTTFVFNSEGEPSMAAALGDRGLDSTTFNVSEATAVADFPMSDLKLLADKKSGYAISHNKLVYVLWDSTTQQYRSPNSFNGWPSNLKVANVFAIQLSPDGRTLFVEADQGQLHILTRNGSTQLLTYRSSSEKDFLELSLDGATFANQRFAKPVNGGAGIEIYNVIDGNLDLAETVTNAAASYGSLLFSADATTLWAKHRDTEQIDSFFLKSGSYDLEAEATFMTMEPIEGDFHPAQLIYMEDQNLLASLSPATQSLLLFDIKTPLKLAQFKQALKLGPVTSSNDFALQGTYDADASQLWVVNNREQQIYQVNLATNEGEVTQVENISCSSLTNTSAGLNGIGIGFDQQLLILSAGFEGQLYEVNRQKPRQQVAPWIVANDGFESRIAIYNESFEDTTAQLTAYAISGEVETVEINLPANTVQAFWASERFPQLTGYALYVNSESRKVHTSFLTFSKDDSGNAKSPSQTTAIVSDDYASNISFGYFPTTWIGAIVIVAPEADTTDTNDVRILIRDKKGSMIGDLQVTLSGKSPLATTLDNLLPNVELPEEVSITVEGQTELGGISFIFNEARQPSMAKAIPMR